MSSARGCEAGVLGAQQGRLSLEPFRSSSLPFSRLEGSGRNVLELVGQAVHLPARFSLHPTSRHWLAPARFLECLGGQRLWT